MKQTVLAFLQRHYLRYHDLLFYLVVLGIVAFSTHFALQVKHQRAQREQELLAAQREIPSQTYTIKQKPIYNALVESGLPKQDVVAIVAKLSSVVNTRRLKPQDEYTLSVEDGHLILLLLKQGFTNYYVANVGDNLVAGVSEVELSTRVKTAAGTIHSSLFQTMVADGLQVPLVLDFTDAFSWTVDFNTDTQNGDQYTALWEENYTPSGEIVSQDFLAGSYQGIYDKKPTYAFYFEDDFYDETGKVSRKMFLKSPISFRGYRISSHFNPARMHPILKIRRPHLGIDYAAPLGTPVQAVADGTVKFAGWKGGFGNFVEIHHANDYTTMYGHLKSFGKGVKVGARIKQGDTVGYIGSTGLSTGPHLDFRIKEKNKFLDFLKMKNRNSAVRDIPPEKRAEFDELVQLYLKELNAAREADQKTPAPEETHE